MISPTIGRVMWFWPVASERGAQPYASMVTYVHDDNMVNLVAFTTDGVPFGAGSVAIVQDDGPWVPGDMPYAEWMPYQKGQAAKTEALEAERAPSLGAIYPSAPLTENDPSVPAQSPSADDNILPAAGNSTL